MLSFRDTGTEGALQFGLAGVGVHVQERIGTKELAPQELGEKK
jgi:hypothetical protein